jgi:hypothetical protein
MDDNFSPRVKDVITYSKEENAIRHDFIGTELNVRYFKRRKRQEQFKY